MNRTKVSQRGVTLTGVLLWGVVIGLVAVMGMKVAPDVIEFFKIRQIMKAVAMDQNLRGAQVAEVRRAYDLRAVVEHIESIKGTDIDVTKEGGALVLSVSYSRQVPLFGPVSLMIDFEAASNR